MKGQAFGWMIIVRHARGWKSVPTNPNSYSEVRIATAMVFGGGALGDHRSRWGHEGWGGPYDGISALTKEEETWEPSFSPCTCTEWGRDMVRYTEKPGREVSPEPNHASTLISDLWLRELWEINICHLRHTAVLCYCSPNWLGPGHLGAFLMALLISREAKAGLF